MEPPLSRQDCAQAVLHHNLQRRQQAHYADKNALFDLD
jgi:hypothetical protein